VVGLSFAALRALVWASLLRLTVFLPAECDAVLRFDFALVIGISFGLTANSVATTEAPPRLSSRRGRIPKRTLRAELHTVPLQMPMNASPFWIMLLLRWRQIDHL
jgi:hypothetical protein